MRKPWTSRSGPPTRRLTVRGFFYAVARRRTATRTGRERQNQTHSVRCAVDATREKESWNHTYISPKNHASSSAATPGSTLPSSSSNEAPPPVEMWDIFSAYDGAVQWVDRVQGSKGWKKERNKREAETLARALDLAIIEFGTDVVEKSAAWEVLIRRLRSVVLADNQGTTACTSNACVDGAADDALCCKAGVPPHPRNTTQLLKT